jgi:imidazolonepropionase-like amidohydrolase
MAAALLAEIQVWDLPSFEDLIYRLGNNAVAMDVKRGQIYAFERETE